jgi:hypothetical protein
MPETPAPQDGDYPFLGSPDWTLVPQSPDWDPDFLALAAEDEDPSDEEYEDPDNAPPAGLDDRAPPIPRTMSSTTS